MESPSNGDLPADVIREILLRLPVKTLLRFKCVCKHWYTLIESRSFINQHFGHESNQERLVLWPDRPEKEGYTFVLDVDEMCSGYEEPDHLQMPNTVAALLGPSNGILCVVSKSGHMALLNPAMRQFKPLPLHHLNVQQPSSIDGYVLGFGLDPLSGYYKLVNFSVCRPTVSVYNSGNDSWRHFEDVDLVNSMFFAYRSVCNNTCLNGVYYWVMELDGGGVVILAFDMSSENFRNIQVPGCITSDLSEELYFNLALFGDSIALLSYDLGKIDNCVDIWVMKEEGCWTKSLTVDIQDFRQPLGFWKNNELLLETGTSLLTLYNVSTQKLRTVEARGKKSRLWEYIWVFSYKESLVSIKGEGDKCKLWDTSSDFVKEFFKYSTSNRSKFYGLGAELDEKIDFWLNSWRKKMV